jgi:hypothetical protein
MPESPIELPAALLALADRLEDADCAAWAVGRCLRELLTGVTPREFEIATQATAPQLLALFPRAVVIAPDERRLVLPTAVGPVDLVPLDATGSLEAELRQRDFRIHAIAYRPRTRTWSDPCAGRDDLADRTLRTPAPALESLAADPVRALRAARLVSELGFAVDPELESALRTCAASFEKLGGRRLRIELDALLLGSHAGPALELLARSGIAAALAPGVAADAAVVVPRLPRELALRWAAWLRGGPVRATLRKLRYPRDRAVQVERILQMHPVDAGPRAARETRARRLARRPEPERAALLALRAAELAAGPGDPAASARLDHLVECLDRALRAAELTHRRSILALDGRAVMAHLGCGPGATVGRALRFLTDAIETRGPTTRRTRRPGPDPPAGSGLESQRNRSRKRRGGSRGRPDDRRDRCRCDGERHRPDPRSIGLSGRLL